jgi:outer membrane protein TolC
MRRDLCLVAACLAGFVFSGCASFSGIHGESQPTSPSALAYTADIGGDGVLVPGDWPRADWWTMFRDPKLDALMQ